MAINFPSAPILDQIFTSGSTSFIWNGSQWDGYSTSLVVNYNASSIVIKDDGSSVGAAGTIDFGANLSVSFASGIATITGSASGDSPQFVTTAAGIHTLSNVGIGTTNPTSTLTVSGDVKVTGIITASSFSGNASSATYATSAGIATYATSAGIATYATSAGIATYATNAGIATYATNAGIATYATSAGIATYATSAGIATSAQGLTGTPNLNVGVVTATTFSGSGSGLTDIPASSITFTISASDSSNYTFSGPGIVSGNTLDPVLYLYKGFTYTFINTTGASHPFAIRVSSGGSSYTPGVSGSTTGTQTFIVPMNAPSTLYYQCTIHGSMGNTINII